MEPNYSWIYLVIFLAIPLARIIPRMIRKKRGEQAQEIQRAHSGQDPGYSGRPEPQAGSSGPQTDSFKPQTRNMLVLGELNKGCKTFECIQKNIGFSSAELDVILEDLESGGLLKIVQKQGMFGTKIELYPTDKGFKEYYS